MPSFYGKGNYGQALYSQSSTWNFAGDLAPTVSFSANLVVTTNLVGDLAPVIAFLSATLTTPQNIAGDLASIVTFAADMSLVYAVVGDLAPEMALGASLTGDWVLAGDMTPDVEFAASAFLGPLWQGSETCPPPAWEDGETCPPTMWTPVSPPQWQPQNFPGSYGLGPYGADQYNLSSVGPWYETELCDGG